MVLTVISFKDEPHVLTALKDLAHKKRTSVSQEIRVAIRAHLVSEGVDIED